jgi:hypothetical protein
MDSRYRRTLSVAPVPWQFIHHGAVVSQQKDDAVVRIDLTPDQRQLVKEETGKTAEAIELTVQELEQRIAPRLSANHNETMLIDGCS